MIAKTSGCRQAPPARALMIVAALCLAWPLFPARAAGLDSRGVRLSISNQSGEPMRCLIMFAHFVVTEAGTVVPGGDLAIAMSRQDSDGALWMPRADGRRMMIETIDCGLASRWAETRGPIPLLAARAGRDAVYGTTCRLDGAVVCTDPAPRP